MMRYVKTAMYAGLMVALAHLGQGQAKAEFVAQLRSVDETPTDWTGSLTFNPFDASLGTLTGVHIDATATIDHQFTASTPVADTVTLTAGPTTVNVGPYLTLSETPVVRTMAGPGDDVVLTPASAILTGGADLPVDIGPLILPVGASSTSSFVSESGNGHGEVRTEAALDVVLTYEYLPTVPGVPGGVPEPSSIVMWGLGILGVVVGRACRREKKAG